MTCDTLLRRPPARYVGAERETFVVQEFRLHSALGGAAEAARLVADSLERSAEPVPLLIGAGQSLERAVVRTEAASGNDRSAELLRRALEPLVAAWQPPRRYRARIAERSGAPVGYYRMAVTEHGANLSDGPGAAADRAGDRAHRAGSGSVALLWIGEPLESPTGLLVIIGYTERHDAGDAAERAVWPSALAGEASVRIYEGASA